MSIYGEVRQALTMMVKNSFTPPTLDLLHENEAICTSVTI